MVCSGLQDFVTAIFGPWLHSQTEKRIICASIPSNFQPSHHRITISVFVANRE